MNLKRRELFAGVLLSSGNKLLDTPALVSTPAAPSTLAWNPPTLLGVNIEGFFFWGLPVDPGQKTIMDALSVSYIRPTMDLYARGDGSSTQIQPAIWSVLSAQPFVGDQTQLVLTMDYLGYVVVPGQPIVLSNPITYPLAAGGSATLPSQTVLLCAGGTAGTWDQFGTITAHGTVRLAAGAPLASAGVVTVSNTKAFHQNFYIQGGILRLPVPAYIAQVAAWMAVGLYIDHGTGNPSWEQVTVWFGLAAARYVRQQEWAFFASLNWDPTKVLISDGPEPLDLTGSPQSPTVWANYEPTLRWVAPTLREYFPKHTLAFGVPNFASLTSASQYINWWPKDSNTMLRVHAYPPPPTIGSSFPLDCSDTAALANYMVWLKGLALRNGIPKVYFQEIGIPMEAVNAQTRYANYRLAILAQNWPVCLWAVEQYSSTPTGEMVMYKVNSDLTGPWVRVPAVTGAFGLT